MCKDDFRKMSKKVALKFMDSNPSSMIYKPRSSYSWTQNYRWQNGKQYKRKTNRGQSALALHSDLSLSLFFSCMKSSKILTLATLLLHNLPSATHPPLKSAKRFFIAAQQYNKDDKATKLFHSVIYNSVLLDHNSSFLKRIFHEYANTVFINALRTKIVKP